MLKFRVEGQKLTWKNPDEVVVAGTKKYLECYFEFDGDAWSGFENIWAFFKNGREKPVQMLLSANRIWKEDGLCLTAGDWSVYLCATTYNAEKEEIERQITSSSVSIRVLAHGQFEDAQNSFESPEIANQYIAAMQVFEDAREKAEDERVEAENARNVFEEYNPDKTYVKGNKVSYEGSSYVLTADEALGTNPTDIGSWLCIAEKGDKGEQGVQGIKGDKGDKGKDGTLWTPLYFELDTKKGENKKAQFEFSRNIFRFGFEEYYGLYMDDYPNVYEWTAGDFFVSNNGKILQIKQLEWINSELLNADVVCISEHNLIVDQVFDGDSENAISGKALAEVLKVLSEQLAFADFSNVSNEDFRAKAEEAGVGGDDAGLADEKNFMVFKGVVSELPEMANEGEVYKLVNECYSVPINATDIVDDVNMLVFRTDKTSAFYKFISFTKDCMYGDSDTTNYQTADTYYYPNGKKTYFPWIFSTWHDGEEGTIAMTSDETFYKALINGGNMEFSYSNTTYLPDDLKSYSIEIKKTYVYHNGEWVEL